MNDRIDVMFWAPSRELFLASASQIVFPGLGSLLAPGESGDLLVNPYVVIDEIGAVTKEYSFDQNGKMFRLSSPIVISGHHVNCLLTGPLVGAVTIGAGTPLENLAGLMDRATLQPKTADGVPAGYAEPSGFRLIDPATVAHRLRSWQ